MFSSKSKTGKLIPSGTTSIIGAGVTLKGDINSSADIRIDGFLKGNIVCSSRVFIGADGVVEGNVEGRQADVIGKVTGNIKTAETLNLRASASVTGDIYVGKLQVDPTVNFNGHCYMNPANSNIVEMIHDSHEQPKVLSR